MRIRTLSLTAATLAAAVSASTAVTAFAAPVRTPAASQLPALDPALLRQAISGLPDTTVTSALVRVTGSAGRWSGRSGVGDVGTAAPPPSDGRFRIGSVSKVFTATVTMQLIAEHRLDVNQTIQNYMPGLLPSSYAPITVGQLLDHTSGLPGGTISEGDAAWFVQHRFDSYTPQQIVDDFIQQPLRFAPGSEQEYNGNNYFVLGLLIEKITGRSYAREVTDRIIRPLGLRDTSVPDADDYHIPGPHAHGYVAVPTGSTNLVDITEQSPWPWAEGGLISSTRDLTRLIDALMKGGLVPQAELRLMTTAPDVPYADSSNCQAVAHPGRACFGMGLMEVQLPNGVTAWGKTGSRPGYTTGVFATTDLQRVIVYSLTPTGDKDGSEMPLVLRIAAAAFDPELAG